MSVGRGVGRGAGEACLARTGRAEGERKDRAGRGHAAEREINQRSSVICRVCVPVGVCSR